MVKLIAEGGVAGHLAHLYDNRGLTFEKIAEILTAASRGELVGTEKTDGFNIYLGFKNGVAGKIQQTLLNLNCLFSKFFISNFITSIIVEYASDNFDGLGYNTFAPYLIAY